MRPVRLTSAALLVVFLLLPAPADTQPGFANPGPLAPREELATFRLLKGFRAELAASEPDVVDPVAFAFDEYGRLWVAELRGYPNEGVGTGTITSGKIRLLEDRDGDGVFEKSTTFADGLRLPISVMPWKGGVLVAVAPDILFLEDTDGDGKADRRRVLYTGFGLGNIQQMINGLQWGLDNWVYGSAGSNGGTIRSGEKPDAEPVVLRGRGVRFKPAQPGSLEPTSGGGQFGLAADDWGRWFTATNSQHLRHIVLPDHELRRNPALPVTATTLDIPDHGAAAQVFRVSPFEAWRVERTQRRKGGPDAKRFAATELVPGGFITSACGPVVYTADRFPESFRGNTFVCDPANNLVHRDRLVEKGATFTAQRVDEGCEFLASTDNWFRPVNLAVGPDGALYVADFYREAIETPLSLPDDIKKRLNLESRGRGRIWRIVPEGPRRAPSPYPLPQSDGGEGRVRGQPALGKAPSAELVGYLDDPNSWWRLTAQRLLVERQDKSVVPALTKLVHEPKTPQGRVHALWTLHGLGALQDAEILAGLADATAGVRENALRVSDERLAHSEPLRRAVETLAGDRSPRVRFQAAFTLGGATDAGAALARIARQDVADPWTRTAVLSSAYGRAPDLLELLTKDAAFTARPGPDHLQVLARLAGIVGAKADEHDLPRVLALLTRSDGAASWQAAVLEGLGQGLQNSRLPLSRLWEQPPPALKNAVETTRPYFTRAAETARDPKQSTAARSAALRLLGYGPFDIAAPALGELLTPQHPADTQLAAVRALAQHQGQKMAELLLAGWPGYSPAVRGEALEALFSRPERLHKLLDAVEQKKVPAGQLGPARLDLLKKHKDAKLRTRAQKLFAGLTTADRRKIVEDYRAALDLKGDAGRGKAVFKKNCATCHRLENEGVEVGANLLAALPNKTAEALLLDILDPSREVDPRYLNYVVATKAGQVYTGLVAAETAASITLRRAEKAEDTILRAQIEALEATAKSVMPEGLEMQLSKQDVADVIAYLLRVVGGK